MERPHFDLLLKLTHQAAAKYRIGETIDVKICVHTIMPNKVVTSLGASKPVLLWAESKLNHTTTPTIKSTALVKAMQVDDFSSLDNILPRPLVTE